MSRTHRRNTAPAIQPAEAPVLVEAVAPVKTKGTSNLAVTISRYRKGYKPMPVEGKRKTQNNGDAVAVALLGVTLDKLKAFSAMKFDGKRYDHLNDGHARMCIGNNIRQAVKAGDSAMLEAVLALR